MIETTLKLGLFLGRARRVLGLPVRVQQLSRFNAAHTLIPACLADVALQEYNMLRRLHT